MGAATASPQSLPQMIAISVILLLGGARAQVCPITDMDQFAEIARICCEGSTGAADCSGGFPVSCTRECSVLLEPFWTACGPMVTMFGDVFPCDETELAAFAEGACHHTNVLFEHAAATGCSDAETLSAWTDNVNAACCEQVHKHPLALLTGLYHGAVTPANCAQIQLNFLTPAP